MPTSALAKSVVFDSEHMHVRLTDGRIISVPLFWYPVLHAAKREDLFDYRIGAGGNCIHWPTQDEDLSIAGLMAGVDRSAA